MDLLPKLQLIVKSPMTQKGKIKNIFSRNEDYRKIAFLNWRMDSDNILNLFNLGDGYLDSSIILIEKCISDNKDKKADIFIFPILTGINHGIEVYLKGITIVFNKMLQNQQSADGTHNLKQLFDTLKARIKDLDGQKVLNEFEKDFEELSTYIDELNTKIESTQRNDKMDFSRYPFSKKEENHFYVNNWTNVELDLENLRNRAIAIKDKLDGFSEYAYFDKYNQGAKKTAHDIR